MPSCPSCMGSATRITDYKYCIEYDRKLLASNSIYECDSCTLCFADPMPDLRDLNTYYSHIYRSPGRPHHYHSAPSPSFRHLSLLSWLSSTVNLTDNSIFELGAGWGELGLLIRTAFPSVSLSTEEPDQHCSSVLEQRGYTLSSSTTHHSDVFLSIHSFEHFTNPNLFSTIIKERTRPGGTVFLEIPNVPASYFSDRPYDSPHLLFWNCVSLDHFLRSQGYLNINITTTGDSLESLYDSMSRWKSRYISWSPDSTSKLNSRFSSYKSRLVDIFQPFFSDSAQSLPACEFSTYPPNSEKWRLRATFTLP